MGKRNTTTQEDSLLLDDSSYNGKPKTHFQPTWKWSVRVCAILTWTVLIFNTVITIYSATREEGNGQGLRVLWSGECEKARKVNSVAHFFINALSTILLGATSYAMQCLSAPTRQELDKAHSRGKVMDIGIHSLRNLRYISKKRTAIWVILLLSSFPLHLFYNSVIFTSFPNNVYTVYSSNEAFINGDKSIPAEFTAPESFITLGYSISSPFPGKYLNESSGSYVDPELIYHNITDIPESLGEDEKMLAASLYFIITGLDDAWKFKDLAEKNELKKVSSDDCLGMYIELYQSSSTSLLVVEDTGALNSTIPSAQYRLTPITSDWVCSQLEGDGTACAINTKSLRGDWQPFGRPVKYCLYQPSPMQCKLQAIFPICILVVLLNLFKAIAISYLLFFIDGSPLRTIGDAIESYMALPDPLTSGMCLATKDEIKSDWLSHPMSAKKFRSVRRRRFRAVSSLEGSFCLAMYLLALITLLALFLWASLHFNGPFNFDVIWRLGAGKMDDNTTWKADYNANLTNAALLTNSSQLILSFVYFTYNGLMTNMMVAHEWSQYAVLRKGLRVSDESRGAQRPTYYLGLPYRISIPLLITSTLLHWLVSQALSANYIEYYVQFYRMFEFGVDMIMYSYSLLAIIAVMIIGTMMVIALFIIGAMPLKSGMPLVSSCSVAISAACHPAVEAVEDPDAGKKKLKWGVIEMYSDGTGHCGFSAEEVDAPIDGVYYS